MVGGFVFYLFDIFCLILFNNFQYGWSLPGGGLALATEGLTKARQVKTKKETNKTKKGQKTENTNKGEAGENSIKCHQGR